ncbi:hypothetical protein [Virgibacillus pantothenticus]|uniref:hypothetical protein n=1 Tax=Virgibacillus pantothenticus TaxID=1473 RepID=UPI0025AF7C09|nr:hypothetical protein [Virgibacillus pantothenticus]
MCFQKFPTSLFTLFLFGLLVSTTFHASGKASDLYLLEKQPVKITVTNNETGENSVIDPAEAQENNIRINSLNTIGDSTVVGYDVFVPIESPNGIITPFTNSS